jgi:hypothetical protein
MLKCSLRSLERWAVELNAIREVLQLYAIREGWMTGDTSWLGGGGERFSHADICEEEAECDTIYAYRKTALSDVMRVLTVGARARME